MDSELTRQKALANIEETCGKGWLPLVNELYDNLPPGIRITEVWDYYGTLKCRFEPENAAFEAIASDIQDRSHVTCSICGQPGFDSILDGWSTTVCQAHFDAFEGKKYKPDPPPGIY